MLTPSSGVAAAAVWQTLSGAQHIITTTPFVYTLYAILLAIAQHLIYLAFNFTVILCASFVLGCREVYAMFPLSLSMTRALCRFILRMPLLEAIATGVMSSQKSAPVAGARPAALRP